MGKKVLFTKNNHFYKGTQQIAVSRPHKEEADFQLKTDYLHKELFNLATRDSTQETIEISSSSSEQSEFAEVEDVAERKLEEAEIETKDSEATETKETDDKKSVLTVETSESSEVTNETTTTESLLATKDSVDMMLDDDIGFKLFCLSIKNIKFSVVRAIPKRSVPAA